MTLDANIVVPNAELNGSAWADITAAINEGVLSVVVPTIMVAPTVQAEPRRQEPATGTAAGLLPRRTPVR
ncbi:hypothetical protein GCM10027282_12950 [Frigoribacterium salinisoli]